MPAVRHLAVVSLLVGTALAVPTGATAAEPANLFTVSNAADGSAGNDSSVAGSVSSDGRVVTFTSAATNLLPDGSGHRQVYVRDGVDGPLTRASVGPDGAPGQGDSSSATLSADGRYVAFQSTAADLVTGDTNGVSDVFVRDRVGATTTRVSVVADGTEGNGESITPTVSADGRFVVYSSRATNLAPGSTGTALRVLVHDRESGTTTEASVRPDGSSGSVNYSAATISADGRYVAFGAHSRDLAPVAGASSLYTAYIRDMQAGTTTRIDGRTPGRMLVSFGSAVSISSDGRYVTFAAAFSGLTTTDSITNVLRYDRITRQSRVVSAGLGGAPANKSSTTYLSGYGPAISADGRYVLFASDASNLVTGDTNGVADVFLRDLTSGTTRRLNTTPAGVESTVGYPGVHRGSIAGDGSVAVFDTYAPLLGPSTYRNNVFLRQP